MCHNQAPRSVGSILKHFAPIYTVCLFYGVGGGKDGATITCSILQLDLDICIPHDKPNLEYSQKKG